MEHDGQFQRPHPRGRGFDGGLISIAQNWYFWKFGHKAGVKVDAAKVIEAVVEAKTGANIEGAITIKKTEESENKEEIKVDGKED